jgi:hypothetical protein
VTVITSRLSVYLKDICPTIATEEPGFVTTEPDPKHPPDVKTAMAADKCMICERFFRDHSEREFERCMDEIVKRAKRYLLKGDPYQNLHSDLRCHIEERKKV